VGARLPSTGSEGHYDQDFRQFAAWGFDFVKVDWCGGFKRKEKLDPVVPYNEIARSIMRAEAVIGHDLRYSICEWGEDHPWTWAPGVGDIGSDIWRTSGDIVAPIVASTPNDGKTVDFSKVLSNFTKDLHPEAQHTGYYNDPDMLVIGMRGISESRDRVHMSLWSISAAPLLIGADSTKLDKAAFAVLTNSAAIAVDQDALGLQVVEKHLKGQGRRAVVFLNTTASPAEMSVGWNTLGLEPSAAAQVWDIWRHKKSIVHGSYTTIVPPDDVAMVILRGVEGQQPRYPSSTQPDDKSKSTAFVGVKSEQGVSPVQIDYVNRTALTHVV
jgi:hypothetical protein